jgi:hypothetical protein
MAQPCHQSFDHRQQAVQIPLDARRSNAFPAYVGIRIEHNHRGGTNKGARLPKSHRLAASDVAIRETHRQLIGFATRFKRKENSDASHILPISAYFNKPTYLYI